MSIGLSCYSSVVFGESPDLKFQTMKRSEFLAFKDNEEAVRVFSERISHNLKTIIKTIKYCKSVGIKHYRLPQDVFSLLLDDKIDLNVDLFPNYNTILNHLYDIGRASSQNKVSLSVRIDGVELGHKNDEECLKNVKKLNFWAWVFDTCGLPQDHSCPIVVSPNTTTFNSPEKFVDKFILFLFQCDLGVRNRLVVENEKQGFWNCHELYENFCSYVKFKYNFHIPLCYNRFHDCCNPSFDVDYEIIPTSRWFIKFYSTWGTVPVFYWAQTSRKGARTLSKKITSDPKEFGVDVIWVLDTKNKDKGFQHLLKQDWNSFNKEISY